MVGYMATGRIFIDTIPAMTIRRARTVAKIGLSMKNLENMPYLPRVPLFTVPGSADLPSGVEGAAAASGFIVTGSP
jgi:hypothetical protein